jgi:hypothetical protein
MPFTPEEILAIVANATHRANYDDKFEGVKIFFYILISVILSRSLMIIPLFKDLE